MTERSMDCTDDLKKTKLLELCEAWRAKYKPSCPESLSQVDEINLACVDFVESIFELIGWDESLKDEF